jgi:hypothetical protein
MIFMTVDLPVNKKGTRDDDASGPQFEVDDVSNMRGAIRLSTRRLYCATLRGAIGFATISSNNQSQQTGRSRHEYPNERFQTFAT